MQSFLGSLNYYIRFIEDFAIYASVLYELREADFHTNRRASKDQTAILDPGSNRDLDLPSVYKPDPYKRSEVELDPSSFTGDDRDQEGRTRWEKVAISFTLLKAKIAATPILKHFDPDRAPVIVVYASKWAVSAALLQEHEGVY